MCRPRTDHIILPEFPSPRLSTALFFPGSFGTVIDMQWKNGQGFLQLFLPTSLEGSAPYASALSRLRLWSIVSLFSCLLDETLAH